MNRPDIQEADILEDTHVLEFIDEHPDEVPLCLMCGDVVPSYSDSFCSRNCEVKANWRAMN